MKIEVGKSYNDGKNRRWDIIGRMTEGTHPFVAARAGQPTTGYKLFNEQGEARCIVGSLNTQQDLVPSKVTKVGYINLFTNGDLPIASGTYLSKDIADQHAKDVDGKHGWKHVCTQQVRWQEEEQ